ncbi:MAG: membrane dipeptidase [Gammaproteobacteria bacterium]|nr:membrane dipeptidase [Gammaproteobacteria bacterium]
MPLSAEQRQAGAAFVERHVTVDVHCHPGRFFLSRLPRQTAMTRALGPPFETQAIADLNAGRVSAALFAGVADMQLLELSAQGIHAARQFAPGEAYADYQRQIAGLKRLVADHEALAGRTPRDVRRAARLERTAAVFAIEGGDFIEDRLDRIHAAFGDGVRAITLVHYHVNQIGDVQTETAVHGGLTPLGRTIVREMNAAGIIIDLAHATLAVTRDVIDASERPVIVSHTNLVRPGVEHPRLISAEHARLVSTAGGVIGSWPSGIGQQSLGDYIDSILRLVDAVGVGHVAVGTDMDANYRPVFTSYRDWSLLPAALLARGLDEAAVARIMGGNFMRVFQENLAAARARSPA